ncbi:hypothetical protein BATDEDRAFT_34500 [Batrachochytrium dendrobatidis JAM81]|uniref:Uncharacterized protein n=1 Tax=Batrachochytrium dendrobatidis (strain JAM81 / FGSC 10211) TaxID=684364 RepID=F4NWS3_BATDJ|nr:uncharacterized protein BATDEDRAFT_34500 [Batrachochytrium dendrobatidis JAM81]EGF82873.1 hypothetical protein BATDEDRAFT_34500 [Batrachochytrium dendrobatidis JAM81]|eukprot:XP_006676828.1 hypothetical protein BATDEDRAFT_34500 [Batrachochytrium dendrobatidis JAM81]
MDQLLDRIALLQDICRKDNIIISQYEKQLASQSNHIAYLESRLRSYSSTPHSSSATTEHINNNPHHTYRPSPTVSNTENRIQTHQLYNYSYYGQKPPNPFTPVGAAGPADVHVIPQTAPWNQSAPPANYNPSYSNSNSATPCLSKTLNHPFTSSRTSYPPTNTNRDYRELPTFEPAATPIHQSSVPNDVGSTSEPHIVQSEGIPTESNAPAYTKASDTVPAETFGVESVTSLAPTNLKPVLPTAQLLKTVTDSGVSIQHESTPISTESVQATHDTPPAVVETEQLENNSMEDVQETTTQLISTDCPTVTTAALESNTVAASPSIDHLEHSTAVLDPPLTIEPVIEETPVQSKLPLEEPIVEKLVQIQKPETETLIESSNKVVEHPEVEPIDHDLNDNHTSPVLDALPITQGIDKEIVSDVTNSKSLNDSKPLTNASIESDMPVENVEKEPIENTDLENTIPTADEPSSIAPVVNTSPAQSSDNDFCLDASENKLISWTTVIRKSHPGSLSHMRPSTRDVIRSAIRDFLTSIIGSKNTALCIVFDKSNRSEPAIPEIMLPAFLIWFNNLLDNGLLENNRKSKSKKSIENQSGLPATPAKAIDTKLFFNETSDTIEDGSVDQVETAVETKHTIEAKDNDIFDAKAAGTEAIKFVSNVKADGLDESTIQNDQMECEEESNTLSNSATDCWCAWVDIIRQKYPQFIAKDNAWAEFSTLFSNRNHLGNVMVKSLFGSQKFTYQGIPPEIQVQFLTEFESAFVRKKTEVFTPAKKDSVILPIYRAWPTPTHEQKALAFQHNMVIWRSTLERVRGNLFDGINNVPPLAITRIIHAAQEFISNLKTDKESAEILKCGHFIPRHCINRFSHWLKSTGCYTGELSSTISASITSNTFGLIKTMPAQVDENTETPEKSANGAAPSTSSHTPTTASLVFTPTKPSISKTTLAKRRAAESKSAPSSKYAKILELDSSATNDASSQDYALPSDNVSSAFIKSGPTDDYTFTNHSSGDDTKPIKSEMLFSSAKTLSQPRRSMRREKSVPSTQPRSNDTLLNTPVAGSLRKNIKSQSADLIQLKLEASPSVESKGEYTQSNSDTAATLTDAGFSAFKMKDKHASSKTQDDQKKTVDQGALTPVSRRVLSTNTPDLCSPNYSEASSMVNNNIPQIVHIDGKSLRISRYNHVLKSMVPIYNTLPKNKRVEMKRAVKKYLTESLGENFEQCVLRTLRDGPGSGIHHTYGVPETIEPEFRKWSATTMTRIFGSWLGSSITI